MPKNTLVAKTSAILGLSLTLGLLGSTLAAASPVDAHTEQVPGVDTRIINGELAAPEDAPYAVAINVPDGYASPTPDGNLDNWCGGSLVSPTKVVTAAHCLTNVPNELFQLNIGSTERLGGTVARVADRWVHPRYGTAGHAHDVAVLTLDRAVDAPTIAINDDVAFPAVGQFGTTYGWGRTETGNSVDQLRKVSVPAVSHADCRSSYNVYDASAMLCAGFYEGGKDACQGDSGGPLVSDGRLVGITSFGRGCALERYYGVYTRVSTYAADISAQL